MFKIFLLTFGMFLLVILGLALGYIFRGKALQGSCGGISALGMRKVCDCEEPCDNLKAKIAKGEVSKAELAGFVNNSGSQFYEVK